jgi:hypothetical protein
MKFTTIFVLAISAMTLASCKQDTAEVTHSYTIPDELKGARIYRMEDRNGTVLHVVVVPYKIVATTCIADKQSAKTISVPDRIEIDGKTYVLTEEQKDE